MKRIIHPKLLPPLVLLGSMVGLCLRLWIIGDGPNASGLYADPIGPWIALWLVSAAVLAVIILGILPLKNPGTYQENYPASVFGFVGTILAGLAMINSGYFLFHAAQATLKTIGGILGVAAGVTMMAAGYARFKGNRCHFVLHLIPCLYLALRLFLLCQGWSNITQLSVFVFPFLASLAVMLATYQRTCFDVGVGKRRHCVLWSLLSVYLCIIALAPVEGRGQIEEHLLAEINRTMQEDSRFFGNLSLFLLENKERLFYGAMAIWMVSDLCSLRPLKRRSPQPEEPQAPAEPEPEQPAAAPERKIDIPLDAEPAPEASRENEPEVPQEPQPEAPQSTAASACAPPLMPEEMTLEQLQDWLDQSSS